MIKPAARALRDRVFFFSIYRYSLLPDCTDYSKNYSGIISAGLVPSLEIWVCLWCGMALDAQPRDLGMVRDGTRCPASRSGYGVGWHWMLSLEIWVWCGMALDAQPRDLGMVWDGTGYPASRSGYGVGWHPASRSGYGVGWHWMSSLEIWIWCGMALDAQP